MEFSAWLKDLGLIATLGGAFCLDRRGAFQLMISQPIVAVPLLAWYFGEPQLGLHLGALLQLIWMGSIHLGVSNPPHETLASLTTAAIVLLYKRYFQDADDEAVWSLATLYGLPVAILGKSLDGLLEKRNISLSLLAQQAALDGDLRTIDHLPVIGLFRSFWGGFLIAGVASAFGVLVIAILRPLFWGSAKIALQLLALYILPALGIGISLSIFRQRRTIAIACAACLCTAVCVLRFLGGKA